MQVNEYGHMVREPPAMAPTEVQELYRLSTRISELSYQVSRLERSALAATLAAVLLSWRHTWL